MQNLLTRSFPAHKQDQKNNDCTDRKSGKRNPHIRSTEVHMQQQTEEKIETN